MKVSDYKQHQHLGAKSFMSLKLKHYVQDVVYTCYLHVRICNYIHVTANYLAIENVHSMSVSGIILQQHHAPVKTLV